MGRHRTARAKQKLIRNTLRPLDSKRNRDRRLKKQRERFIDERRNRVRHNQQTLYADTIQISAKPSDLQRVKKQVNATFLARVHRVQSSFAGLMDAITRAAGVIEVLDARDPQSFRFLPLEEEVARQSKPLILLLTKIDLVPIDSVSKWIEALTSVAPTFAVSLAGQDPSIAVLATVLGEVDFTAVGAPGVGKTTLAAASGGRIADSEGWQFTMCGNSLALAGSVPWRGRIRELAVETMERIQGEVIFRLMGIKKDNSIGTCLAEFARKCDVRKVEGPQAFVDNFVAGNWRWFAAPPVVEDDGKISNEQMDILRNECAEDTDNFIVLGKGEAVKVDARALEYEAEEASDSDEEDSADDDDTE